MSAAATAGVRAANKATLKVRPEVKLDNDLQFFIAIPLPVGLVDNRQVVS